MGQSVLLHTFPNIINPFSHGLFRVSRLTAVGCMRQPRLGNAGKNEEGWGMYSGVWVQVFVCMCMFVQPNKACQTNSEHFNRGGILVFLP
jgi:hypothetical protein